MTGSTINKKVASVSPPRPAGVRHLRNKLTQLTHKRSLAVLADRRARDAVRMSVLEERYSKSTKRLENFEKKYVDVEKNNEEMDAFVAYLRSLGDKMPSVEEFARDAEKWEAIANVREHSKLTEKIVKRSKKRATLWM